MSYLVELQPIHLICILGILNVLNKAHVRAYGIQTIFDSTPGTSQLIVSKNNQQFVKRRSLIAEKSAEIGQFKMYNFLLVL